MLGLLPPTPRFGCSSTSVAVAPCCCGAPLTGLGPCPPCCCSFYDHDYGTLPNTQLPRLIDMGQCNDAYSAIVVASKLAEVFETDVNGLPLSLDLSWWVAGRSWRGLFLNKPEVVRQAAGGIAVVLGAARLWAVHSSAQLPCYAKAAAGMGGRLFLLFCPALVALLRDLLLPERSLCTPSGCYTMC